MQRVLKGKEKILGFRGLAVITGSQASSKLFLEAYLIIVIKHHLMAMIFQKPINPRKKRARNKTNEISMHHVSSILSPSYTHIYIYIYVCMYIYNNPIMHSVYIYIQYIHNPTHKLQPPNSPTASSNYPGLSITEFSGL